MELAVRALQVPNVIEFNFEELKQEITERASHYASIVYTDEQIKDAKKDRASLNKFVKALLVERLKIKKQYMQPYEDFEKKLKELDGIVQTAIGNIDKQVRAAEQQQKQDKRAIIEAYFVGANAFDFVTLEKIFNEKWLNATVRTEAIFAEIDVQLESIKNDLATLSNLPEFSFEATEVYKTTLDLNRAINEGKRLSEIAKRKAEYETERARAKAAVEKQPETHVCEAPTAEVNEAPSKQWVNFKALLTREDAVALREFFVSRNIEFKAI